MADSTPPNTSTSTVISTLVANLVLCGIFVSCFILLRIKFKRIYSPKASFDIVDEEKRPEPLNKDPFSWIFVLLTKPHSFIIQHCGLDGYFFLRYLLVFGTFFTASLLICAVLMPVNATGGAGKEGLDLLSISNVQNPKRYYAHVFMAWIFYGSLVFILYRELFLYNSLRCAALSTPRYAQKLSSRVVLFANVPDSMLDEKQFHKVFNGVKRIFVARNSRKLTSLVRKRDALVNRLELAENKLLKTAYKAKLKADKKGITLEPVNEISTYVPDNKRPRFKPNGKFSAKVDTIRYCLEQIPKIEADVVRLQKRYRTTKPKNSLFVEFEDQYSAQLAFQTTVHHNPLRIEASATGVEPGDVIWTNLRMFWWESIVRRTIAVAAIIALIIFWTIPVAFVGVISNITYLTNKLPWLRWILNLRPHALLGIITGLLPTVMLALLMMVLPMFIRALARISGAKTAQGVEMFTQNAYFAFQIVQTFLVVTVASSATSTVTKIINEPTSAMDVLATNLPLASNFFISYIVLQGLSIAGATLFQVVGLFLYYILGALLDGSVRKKWNRWTGLGSLAWGTTFPIYANLASITIAYAVISPLILVFAAFAFLLVFIAFSYNLAYVNVEGPDNRGLHYPRAIFQTFTGIYLGQICLLGLFIVGKGWGPIVLQAIGLIFVVFCHLNLNSSFDRLFKAVPLDIMKALDGVSETPSFSGHTEYKSKVLDRQHKDHRLEQSVKDDKEANLLVKHEIINQDLELNDTGAVVPLLADRDFKRLESTNPIIKFFRPDVFLNFRHLKALLPATYNIQVPYADDKHSYDAPVVSARIATVWIPKDPMGLSSQEVENARGIVPMSDANSGFNEKGKVVFLGPPPS